MKIFSGSSHKALTESIAQVLGQSVSPIEMFIFPDGERRMRVLESVVDEECIVVQPTASPADINYMELFFIADALKRSGARSITAVIPYLGYQRQHHLFREGEAVSLDVIIKTLQSVGINRVVTLDLHSVKIEEAFPFPVVHLSALPLFSQIIIDKGWNDTDAVLVSPDKGGVRGVKILSEMLSNMPYAVVGKNRDLATGAITVLSIEGTLAKRALVIDDMISSGATVMKAAELLKQKGVEEVIVFTTHGVFASGASKDIQDSVIDKVFITDSVLIPEAKKFEKLEILSIADIIAKALHPNVSE